MAKTYVDLQKQIETLKREADSLKSKELKACITRIKADIATFGLTAADLDLRPTRRRGVLAEAAATLAGVATAATSMVESAAAVIYKDDTGHTWGGRGPRPKWLRDALAAGKTLEELAVKQVLETA